MGTSGLCIPIYIGVQQNNGFSYYNVTTGNHWDPQKGTAGDVYEGEGNHLSQ